MITISTDHSVSPGRPVPAYCPTSLDPSAFFENIYVSDLLPEEELCGLLTETGLGLETIQFSVAENLDHFQDTLTRERSRLHSLQDPPLTIHGPFLDLNPMCYDRLVREATEYRFAQAYEAARALGASAVIFHSGMLPGVYFLDGWAERIADFWNHFLEKRSGIRICMENVLDPYALPLAKAASLVEHPDFSLCLDIGHAYCYSKDSLEKWVEALRPYIRHVHLHDNDGSRDQHLPLGAGTIPFKTIFASLFGKDPEGKPSFQQNTGIPGCSERSGSDTPAPSWTIECCSKEDVLRSYSFLLSAICLC